MYEEKCLTAQDCLHGIAADFQNAMKKTLDNFIDRFLPPVSIGYRKLRDYRQFHNAEAPDSGFGFTLAGDNGLSAGHVGAPEVPVLTKLLESADAFVDVGANVGFYTCVAAKIQKPCITIEPHPYNLHCLYRNVRENHFRFSGLISEIWK